MKNSIAVLSLLVATSLTGCPEGEDGSNQGEVDGYGYLTVNGQLAGYVQVDPGTPISLEFVPGNQLVDLSYAWYSDEGGAITQDDSNLASFTADEPGRYTVSVRVRGKDPNGMKVSFDVGLLVIVNDPLDTWMTGLIGTVTFDGVAQAHGSTSTNAAGQTVMIIVDEALGASDVFLAAEVSAGELLRNNSNQFMWKLPTTPGIDATIEIRAQGKASGLDIRESYTHLIRVQ